MTGSIRSLSYLFNGACISDINFNRDLSKDEAFEFSAKYLKLLTKLISRAMLELKYPVGLNPTTLFINDVVFRGNLTISINCKDKRLMLPTNNSAITGELVDNPLYFNTMFHQKVKELLLRYSNDFNSIKY